MLGKKGAGRNISMNEGPLVSDLGAHPIRVCSPFSGVAHPIRVCSPFSGVAHPIRVCSPFSDVALL